MPTKMRYEAVVFAALILALAAWWFKQVSFEHAWSASKRVQATAMEIKEAAALKKIWYDKKLTQNGLQRLKNAGGGAKTWKKEGKTIRAVYSPVTLKQVDDIVTQLMRIPVKIERLRISKADKTYRVEIACKQL
jgi:hypothetical protein